MSKLITKLTPEQEANIPAYIQKWVGQAQQPLDRQTAFSRLKKIYPDNLIIFTESFDNTVSLIKFIKEICRIEKVEYGSQLYSQLGSQLRSQLRSQLDSQLDSQLRSQLDSQLGSQLYSQLGSQLRSQLRSQLDSQLGSQLYSQLDSQLRSQLYSQLGSQLGSQLRSQLYSQLYSQLGSQLRSQLYSQLGSQLDSIKWSYYVSYYWYIWAGWYDYAQYIGVEFDVEKLKEFIELLQNAPLIVFAGNIVFVCEKPQIAWENELLHSESKMAVKWADETGFYFLDGVMLEKDLWSAIVKKAMSFGEIMKIENADHRALAFKYNPESMLSSGASLIDKSERGNELFLIAGTELNEFLEEPKIWFLRMQCPTGRVFVEGVPPDFAAKNRDADVCQAHLLGITPNQYRNLAVEG